MSYAEALQDNILIDKDVRGFTRYRPPCSVCGALIASWSYRRDVKYICVQCRNAVKDIRSVHRLLSAENLKRTHKSAHQFTCVQEENMVE